MLDKEPFLFTLFLHSSEVGQRGLGPLITDLGSASPLGRREEHSKDRLHLSGAGTAAPRLPDVSRRLLHGPGHSVRTARCHAAA